MKCFILLFYDDLDLNNQKILCLPLIFQFERTVHNLDHPNVNRILLFKGCNSEWIGDGNCDDENNKEQCNYDGGDCCGENVNKQFCSECICLEETVKSLQIPQPKCSGHYFKANLKIYCTFSLPDMGPVNHAEAYKVVS